MLPVVRYERVSRSAGPMLVSLAVVVAVLGCQAPRTTVGADPTRTPVDAAALVEQVAVLLEDNYLDPAVAEQCAERVRTQLAAGAYGPAHTDEQLAGAITNDLQAVSHDLHMRVAVVSLPSESTKLDEETGEESSGTHPLLEKLDVYEFEKRGNFGVMDAKWLSGNVGYLDLRAFLDLARVRPKIESAMTFLSDTDAIVIDLRSLVRGGYPETVGFIAGYVPIGRSVNPVTGGSWEGVGVTPDVPTAADDALDAALELARAAAEERKLARESADRELMLDVEARLFAAVGEYGQGAADQGAAGLRSALQEGLSGGVLTEDMINDVGYYCLENGLTEAAVGAFSFNTEQFPGSANAHDSLGEALVEAGRIEEAVASYRRALELDPRISSSRAALDDLTAEE